MPAAPSEISRGALDTVAPLFKRPGRQRPRAAEHAHLEQRRALRRLLHNVVQRVAQYICDTTVVDFVAHHELRIDHVYETFYTLIMGLLMYIRTHPDVPDETVKGNHRLDTPHRGLYRQVSGA